MSVGVQGRTIASPAADAARVAAIRNNLDLRDPEEIAAFGERARKEVLASVERLLAEVRSNDAAEALDLAARARARIETHDPSDLEPRGGLDNLFNGRTARLHRFRRAVDQTGAFVGDLAADLAERAQRLERKTEALNGLHEQARTFILELDAYLEAGRARLGEARAAEAAEAQPSGTGEDPQPPAAEAPAPRPLPAPSSAERLAARLAELERARSAALQQLPLVRMAQNADAFLVEDLNRAASTLTLWRRDWNEMLGAGVRDKARFRPHIPALAESKLTTLETLAKAIASLGDGRARRAEAEERMQKVAEAVRRAS